MSIPVHFNGSLLNVMGNGIGVVPPAGPLIVSLRLHVTGGGAESSGLSFTLLRFGTSGTVGGAYTSESLFLTEHPGVATQDFSGITPDNTGPVPIPALAGITSIVTTGPPNVGWGVYGARVSSDMLSFVYTGPSSGYGDVLITFSVPVDSVGVRVDSESTGTYNAIFTFNDATPPFTLSNTSSYPPAFNSFSGYSTATGATPAHLILEDGSDFLLEDGSLLLLE